MCKVVVSYNCRDFLYKERIELPPIRGEGKLGSQRIGLAYSGIPPSNYLIFHWAKFDNCRELAIKLIFFLILFTIQYNGCINVSKILRKRVPLEGQCASEGQYVYWTLLRST